MTARAEARRAARTRRPDVVTAVVSSSTPKLEAPHDAESGARFTFAMLHPGGEEWDFVWEWEQGTAARDRLAALVRANPPPRLRRHYRRLADDLRRVPDAWIGFARATLET